MKRFLIILLSLTGVLTSCEFLISDYSIRESDIKPDSVVHKVITFATYFSGEGLDVSLSQPMDLTRPVPVKIGEAKISLFKSKNILCLDTMVNFEIGNHFFNIKNFISIPGPGDTLTLRINASGFSEVSGNTVIPPNTPIKTMNASKISASDDFYRFTITFDDQATTDNYYMVSSVYYLIKYSFPLPGYGNIYDTIYSEERKSVPLTDPVFDFMPDYRTSIKEPFSSSNLKPRVFSDRAFNGSEYGLRVEIPVRNDGSATEPDKKYSSEYEIELYEISRDLFEFITTSFTNEIIEDDIYSQPIFVYCNMSNKAGFFGAVGYPSKSKQLIENGDLLKFSINN
jgi:hypothetical protein